MRRAHIGAGLQAVGARGCAEGVVNVKKAWQIEVVAMGTVTCQPCARTQFLCATTAPAHDVLALARTMDARSIVRVLPCMPSSNGVTQQAQGSRQPDD